MELPHRILVVASDDEPALLVRQQISSVEVLDLRTPEALPSLIEREDFATIVLGMGAFAQGQDAFMRALRFVAKRAPSARLIAILPEESGCGGRELAATGAFAVHRPLSALSIFEALQSATAPCSERAWDTFGLVTGSAVMRDLLAATTRVAATDASVLLLGETGTGKDLVAQAIHSLSGRSDWAFVRADLATLNPSLVESELFGHVKGAFTGAQSARVGRFEAASGGTLFLDEIGNVPASSQAKLLTALQQREVVRVGSNQPVGIDVRLVSATNRSVVEMERSDTFRSDLLYRINTVELTIPPLRDRAGDVLILASHFLGVHAARYGSAPKRLSAGAEALLEGHLWPGNVRELRHVAERMTVLVEGETISADDLLRWAPRLRHDASEARPAGAGVVLDSLRLEDAECAIVSQALALHAGNVSRAARTLAISRRALYRRVQKFGL